MEETEIAVEQNGERDKPDSYDSRYRRLFETAKDGIILLDGDTGQITDANPFLQDLLGYSLQELLGKVLWEIDPLKDMATRDAMRQLQNKEYVHYENLPLEAKSGQQIQVEFVSNVYWVDGFRVMQCNIRDITARRRAEEGIRTANNELRASVAQLLKRDEEMKSLIRLNELLQSCTTQAEAYRVVALVAVDLFGGESGCLAMLHPGHQTMETVAQWGDETAIMASFSLEDCWALRRGMLHEVSNPRMDLLCNHFVQDPKAGYLCVPLILPTGINGLLCLTAATGTVKGSSARQRLAVTAGQTIKQFLYSLRLREELRDQATHDPLTGMCNRRYLEESLSRELHRGRRSNSPLCVVMLDLDKFKPFNDTFGHDAGDALLRQMGHMICGKLRNSDISCRYGGDEFVLVLPDSSLPDTEQRMEQILDLVRDLPTRNRNQRADFTISAGIASAPEHGSTAAELLQAADKAMYAAKHAGGDCVVVYHANGQLETVEGACVT